MERYRMRRRVLAFDLETGLRQIRCQRNRLRSRKSVVVQHQMQIAGAEHRMKPPADTVERDDLDVRGLLPGAAVAEAAEDRIIRQNRGGHPHRTTKTKILLGGII